MTDSDSHAPNVTSEELHRRSRHQYREVTLFHSQAHLGDLIQNNNYHTHYHHQNAATQTVPFDLEISSVLDDEHEKYLLAFIVIFCMHTGASLTNVPACIGIFTWNRHIELSLWIRIGAAASLLKYIFLLGLAVWDALRNMDNPVIRPYAKHFIKSWLVLTSLNMPRTLMFLDYVDKHGTFLSIIVALVHLCGEIAEHFACFWYLRR